eukprot:4075471-Pyramimonas_sp.AAC.1
MWATSRPSGTTISGLKAARCTRLSRMASGRSSCSLRLSTACKTCTSSVSRRGARGTRTMPARAG